MSASAGGRTDDAERERLRDRDDEQRALGVDHIGDGGNVFDGSEEVGRLDEDACGLRSDGLVEGIEIDASGFGECNLGERQALIFGVGGDDLAILRVDAAGEDGFAASGDADGHHDGLSRAG